MPEMHALLLALAEGKRLEKLRYPDSDSSFACAFPALGQWHMHALSSLP